MKKYLFIPFCVNLVFANVLENNQTINESLDYLLENPSNFPITDYIWNVDKAKGNLKIEDLHKEIFETLKKEQTKTADKAPKTQEDNKTTIKEIEPKELTKQEVTTTKIPTQSRGIEYLIKQSILADRANPTITDLQQENKNIYGDDSFSNQPNINVATNEHKLFRMIRAGRLIPATLTTAISSDFSGLVTAQVEEDIYATAGNAVMIPRGSKAIGYYQSNNRIGLERINIQWREIITPQGVNILLTNAFSADNLGMSGARGSVNNKYFERYGIPYGISTLSNVLLLALSTKGENNIYTQQIYEQSKSDLNQVLSEVIKQQSKIQPTIEIKQGSRIYLVPTHHIWFPKPKNKEIMTQYFEKE